MLAIRLQRTGRKGHANYRVIVQEARLTPTSGKVVALIGRYDPHSKTTILEKEKASFYLEHGAQPSDRVARLLKNEGVKLPKWVRLGTKQKRAIRNPDKLRRNRPTEVVEPVKEEALAEPEAEKPTEEVSVDSESTSDEVKIPDADSAPVTDEKSNKQQEEKSDSPQ